MQIAAEVQLLQMAAIGTLVKICCRIFRGKNYKHNPFTQTLELVNEQILPKKINKLKKASSKNLLKHVNSG